MEQQKLGCHPTRFWRHVLISERSMKTFFILAGVAATLGVIAVVVFVFVIQNVEQPSYKSLAKEGPFELRDYPRLVVAEVRRQGDRRKALSKGFSPLARYIFAKEREGERISMTAPVTQSPRGDEWIVGFIMPSGYGLERLPAPAAGDVRLREIEPRRMGAIRFSGSLSDEHFAEREAELRTWIASRGLSPASAPVYAYYNDPLTPWFLRRNEVMIEVAEDAGTADTAMIE